MINVTIFTPTYNRGYLLHILYKSLLQQSFKNFEWIIYDDGSKDNTEDVVKNFIDDSILDIKYIKGENRGKHVCINRGSDIAKGELFFIVDSDDYLLEDSLLKVMNIWSGISNKNNFAGIGGRAILDGKSFKFNFEDQYFDCNQMDFSLKYNNNQDKAEVYKTELLQKYKFPEIEGENFITEAVLWYKFDEEGYKMRWFNEDIYVCKYLPDGLSKNSYKKKIDNIKGTCKAYNILSSYSLPSKYKFRYKINYFRYGLVKFSFKKLKIGLIDKKNINTAGVIGCALMIKDKFKM